MTRTVRGARVVVTAATGDLGRLFAARAVVEGARAVVLWDGSVDEVEALATELRAFMLASLDGGPWGPPGVAGRAPATTVVPFAVAPGELGAIAQTAHAIRTSIGPPDVVLTGRSDAASAAMVDVFTTMHVVREFLPGMLSSPRESRIVVVASDGRDEDTQTSAASSASRFALISWADALRRELRERGDRKIRVTTLAPARLASGMFELRPSPAADALPPGRMDARRARIADHLWSAMLAGMPRADAR